MNQSSPRNSGEYAPIAKSLHWLVASFILVQYVLIELAERAEHAGSVVQQLGLIANHKSVGISILLLATLRLCLRFFLKPPPLPRSMPKWQVIASHVSHSLLYVFLFALPLTGWLMSSANAYSVSWFNLIPLPDLIAANKTASETLHWAHELLADLLLVVAALHVGAALKHHFIDRDSVLSRMLSRFSIALFVISTLIALMLFSGLFQSTRTSPSNHSQQKIADQSAPPPSSSNNNTPFTSSALPTWEIDYQNSHIKFVGQQAGAPFTGEWTSWSGTLQFDKRNLQDSRFIVDIDINSVFSNDGERDDYIKSFDFFDAVNFPNASFRAKNFTQRDGHEADLTPAEETHLASGELVIKNMSHPVQFSFISTNSDNKVSLKGTAKLNRHQWNIGIGDWSDPTWVGTEVLVEVLVNATIN